MVETRPPEHKSFRSTFLTGIISGSIAGLLMAVAAMIHFAAYGERITAPFRFFAAALFGIQATNGGLTVVVTGILLFILVSLFLGIIFAAIVGTRFATPRVLVLGIAFAVIVWAIESFLVLPRVNPLLFENFTVTTRTWWLFSHLIFGLGLSSTTKIHRYLLHSI